MTNCTPRAAVNSVLREPVPVILPVTTQILNRSLLTSVFLSAWKGSSEFVPTLQRGPGRDHKIPNENRPLSLLRAHSNAKCHENVPTSDA